MKLSTRIYLSCTKIYPKKLVLYLQSLLRYAGKEDDVLAPQLGRILLLSIVLALIVLAAPWAWTGAFSVFYIIYALGAMIILQAVFMLLIYFKAEDRTAKIEEALPDILQLMSANMKAGMTPYQALKLSAREEFGPLSEEIKRVTTRALGTESFEKSLTDLSARVNSESFRRTMKLFTSSIRSGGRLAKLLEELAMDITETRQLKRELVTSTKTYTAFIMFTVVIGAPLLLAISLNFIQIITDLNAKTSKTIGSGFGMDFLAGGITVTPEFIFKISIILLIVTPTLASCLIGVIKEGKPLYGLRYSVWLSAACLVIFFVFKKYVGGFLGMNM